MSENLEEQLAAEKIDYRRYLNILRRRHLLFITLVLAVWLLVWGLSWFMSPKYKSSTLILVEQPAVARAYVDPNVSDNLQDRLESITEQILSRTRLLMIIDKLHLYAGGDGRLTSDQKVELMRKDITVDLVRDQHNGSITAFRVSYVGPTPNTAQAVTGELTKLFISENVTARQRQAVQATQFIRDQLAAARSKLAEQDATVRAFQFAHEGELPSQQASNLQILSGLQAQLQNEEDALNTAKQQRVYIQSLMEQYRNMPSERHGSDGSSSSLAEIDQQLSTLQTRLAALTARYTARYPGVEQLKQEIARAQQTRRQLVARLNATPKSTSSSASSNTVAVGAADRQPMLQLNSQLQANETEVANRERAIASLKGRIGVYQARLNAQPVVEQELANLTRGYRQSQANFDDLLRKENESQMASNMEQMQEGKRFSVLDPPSLPLRPFSPNRLKMWIAGVGAGLGVGLLFVWLIEKWDDRLYSDEEVDKALSVGVLAEIPEITTDADQRRVRRHAHLRWAMTAFVCIIIVMGGAVSYLHV